MLLLVEPVRSPVIDRGTEELCARLKSLGHPPDHFDLDPGFAAARPASRVTTYRKIEEFLNLCLNHFAVKIGPTKEVP